MNTRLICPKHYSKKNTKLRTNFFLLFFHFFTFLPVTLKLAYFAPLNGAGRFLPVNFNYPRCLENSNLINFWWTSWVPLWWDFFLVFFSLTFFPVTWNSANFAPLNSAGRIFSKRQQQKFLENSNIINFWLTSWVPSW